MAQVMFKRVCLGAGAYSLWSGFGAVVSQYQEEERVGIKRIKLLKEINDLKATIEEEGETGRRLIEGLHEELECIGEMNEGVHNLWKERARRWSDVKEFDDMMNVMPWVFWHWKRLEKWYEVVASRLENHEDFKQYEYTSMHLNDMRMAHVLDAYDTEVKLPQTASTIGLARQASNNDPFLFVLEASLKNTSRPSLQDFSVQKQTLASIIAALPATDTFKPLYAEASSAIARHPMAEYTVEELGSKLNMVGEVLQHAEREATSEDLQRAIKLTDELKAGIIDYRILIQAHNLYEAYMTTLLLSLSPAK
eukprot:TRINITY_DN8818_c0_g1_i1.p1 TRINITY_DN8818_c0_g1~~TRINITY_DN8818_c0_g1_i1.p1  ORF type:complete len:324 (+),score=95.44 TRINITY_DN8818_c0_g1_i1:51-974(+)